MIVENAHPTTAIQRERGNASTSSLELDNSVFRSFMSILCHSVDFREPRHVDTRESVAREESRYREDTSPTSTAIQGSCPSYDSQGTGKSLSFEELVEKSMDVLAFPEEHVSCGTCNTFKVGSHPATPTNSHKGDARCPKEMMRGSRKRWKFYNRSPYAGEHQESKDIIDRVFEGAEAGCGIYDGPPTILSLGEDGDLLDLTCNGMERTVCEGELGPSCTTRISNDDDPNIQRNNSLIEGNEPLQSGGLSVVHGRDERHIKSSPIENRIHYILNGEVDALDHVFNSVENFACANEAKSEVIIKSNQGYSEGCTNESTSTPQRGASLQTGMVRRDTSLLSESSASTTSVVSKVHMAHAVDRKESNFSALTRTTGCHRNTGGDVGMELLLEQKQHSIQDYKTKGVKRRNFIPRFLAMKPKLSLKSEEYLTNT